MQPTVSLLTITQRSRQPSLLILKDLVQDQTYSNIIEWVIVEGSPSAKEAKENAAYIATLQQTIPIRYIRTEGGLPIGTLRQLANESAIGDIRVVLDDDDYYPAMRVDHAVKSLLESKKRLAGCSPMFLYDYQLNKLFKFRSFGLNHSVSSCMAWTRDYPGVYDPDARFAEETSFTNGFTESMVQLEPLKTIIQSSHTHNTYSKKKLVIQEIEKPILDYIPEHYFKRFHHILGDLLVDKADQEVPIPPVH